MKKQIIAVLLILLLTSIACSVQNFTLDTIEPQIVIIREPLPRNTNETDLVFKMTGGEFSIIPGADDLVNGSIKYNVKQWEPQYTRRDNFFEITQVNPLRISGIPSSNAENIWDLALTNSVPLSLTIEGGASENDFNFTGLQLTKLRIIQGASDTIINFDAPNPTLMEELIFTTGASSAKLYGLGNANFKTMNMSAGAGNYTLNFNGALSQDAVLNIQAGISNFNITIPENMRAVLNNKGTVSNINTRGTWLLANDTYSTLNEGFTLTINLDMAVGNVNLVHEE